MKYIRTKDGRIITFLNEDRETKLPKRDLRFYYVQPNNVIAFIGKDEIIKQADTIEELCDGFIFKDTSANELHFLDKNDGISLLGASLFEETLRGFIETDKGLIYVAKMNEEGVLCLI